MFLGDLHIHSKFSDGSLSIPELVDLYGEAGFGVIAITDHICEEETFLGKGARYLNRTLTRATFPLYQKILKTEAKRAWDRYRMVVLPGFELTKNSIRNSRSAHILGIGSPDFISADQDIVEMARAIRSQGGLAVAAHPVSTKKLEAQTYHLWERRRELAQELDAWEVASGPELFQEVVKSNLPKLANSDLHKPKQMSSWKTAFTCERHPEAILEAVRQQEIAFRFFNAEEYGSALSRRRGMGVFRPPYLGGNSIIPQAG